ncbi:MAG TPA: DNA starvation/stationary phase protection protein Dps [Candidatus Binatia bacterium]|nr:DNA starvation/stationary phase protection protein Dps [Candidatus Binatia bacterium]
MPTRNDLPDNSRKATIALLNARLVDAIDLRLALKQAHWNVKGPSFIALHEMFDQMQGRVNGFVDEIAERAVTLGGQAIGTTQAVATGSKLAAYPTDINAERAHIEALADRVAVFAKLARQAIDAADEAGDKDTADLFTAVSRQMDMDLWFLEAHLQ